MAIGLFRLGLLFCPGYFLVTSPHLCVVAFFLFLHFYCFIPCLPSVAIALLASLLLLHFYAAQAGGGEAIRCMPAEGGKQERATLHLRLACMPAEGGKPEAKRSKHAALPACILLRFAGGDAMLLFFCYARLRSKAVKQSKANLGVYLGVYLGYA
jgi:hypothetical protein